MREDARTKAERYLVQGRVRLLRCDEDGGYLSAEVRSDGATIYTVAFGPGGWSCSCPMDEYPGGPHHYCPECLLIEGVEVGTPADWDAAWEELES
jgi:hypothetical protein